MQRKSHIGYRPACAHRRIHHARRRLAQARVLRVARHADDELPLDALAERARATEILPRHCLVDDGHLRRGRLIARAERPAGHDWRGCGLEEARTDLHHRARHLRRCAGQRAVDDAIGHRGSAAEQSEVGVERRRLHTRYRFERRPDLACDRRRRRAAVEGDEHDGLTVEAGVEPTQILKCAHE